MMGYTCIAADVWNAGWDHGFGIGFGVGGIVIAVIYIVFMVGSDKKRA